VGAWFEDESFWIEYAYLMFDEKRWAEVPAVIDGIEKLTSLRSPRADKASEGGAVGGAAGNSGAAGGDLSLAPAVLDACCGPGRHSLELARRGWRVTGLDLTQPYLEAARESAYAEGYDIEFVRGDVREFRRPGAYDLCLNLFTSFGYFEDRADDLAALSNFRASLKPGGALVLETIGKETAARDFVEGEWFERGGWTVCTEYGVVGAWEGLKNRWLLIREGERVDRSFVQRLYSGVEMRGILLEAGFDAVELFGGTDGRPYDEKAASLVAVARRAI